MKRCKEAFCRRLNQSEAPFLEAVVAYADGGDIPFHTPGHKQGRGAEPLLLDAVGAAALRLDVSDVLLSPAYDDSWTAALAAAERLAAHALGADYCRCTLVNGTSGGVQRDGDGGCCRPQNYRRGEQHRSVIGVLFWRMRGRCTSIRVRQGGRLLVAAAGVRVWSGQWRSTRTRPAVSVTYPTYEGAAADLAGIAGRPRPGVSRARR